MKIRTLTMTTVLCAVGAIGGLVAADAAATHIDSVHDVAAQKQITGKIIKADIEANTFAIQTEKDETMEFSVDRDTVYTVNGERSTKEQALRVGAQATVHFEEDDKSATRVSVRSE